MPKSISSPICNRLAEVRKSRGVSAADLASRAGIRRQTIYAIEAGSYVPNTEVSLRLARELEVTVEQLFSLAPEAEPAAPRKVEILGEAPGRAVRVCRVGERWIGVPARATELFLPPADGVLRQSGALLSATEAELENRLLIAGCDPATGLLAHIVEKLGGTEVVAAPASSSLALKWLKQGKVHIAGTHLEDPATGEFNLPFIRRLFAPRDVAVITYARWEEGFLVAAGNSKRIRTVEDLARKGVRFVNREKGAGSRALLDRLLGEAGIPARRISGYERIAAGHVPAAVAVMNGQADCCLATRSAALAFGLDFIPLREERYDFVVRRQSLELPAVRTFLDLLQRADLRRKIGSIAGYDTAQTGAAVA